MKSVPKLFMTPLLIPHRQVGAGIRLDGVHLIGLQPFLSLALLGETGVEVVDRATLGALPLTNGVDGQAGDDQVFSLHGTGTVVGGIGTADVHADGGIADDESAEAEEDTLLAIGVGGLAGIVHHVGRPLLGDGKKLPGRGDEAIRRLLQTAREAHFGAGKVVVSLFTRGEEETYDDRYAKDSLKHCFVCF